MGPAVLGLGTTSSVGSSKRVLAPLASFVHVRVHYSPMHVMVLKQFVIALAIGSSYRTVRRNPATEIRIRRILDPGRLM